MLSDADARQRFSELVGWYANGTLAAEDQRWMDDYVRDHPEAAAELRWTQSLMAQVVARVPEVSPEAGLDRLMARIHAEARPARAPAPTLGERVRAFLASFELTPAFALAAAVIVLQTGVIGSLVLSRSGAPGVVKDGEYRSADLDAGATQAVLQVSFKPDTREIDMRTQIVAIGGRLAGGPGQLGNYLIVLPSADAEKAVKKLESSGVVDDVRILPRLPAAP